MPIPDGGIERMIAENSIASVCLASEVALI